jgi:tetraacyldisaccharide 4'-kinase
MPLSGGVPLQFPHLGDSRLLAFAGIADPDSFFNELESRALNIVHRMRLPDHSTYTKRDLNAIVDAMSQSGAELAITTEKDGVKLFELPEGIKSRILLARLELVFDNPSVLDESLRNLLQKQL